MYGSTVTRTVVILKADVRFSFSACSENVANGWTVDYNSWIESDKARKLAASLDKDVIIVEGTSFCELTFSFTY